MQAPTPIRTEPLCVAVPVRNQAAVLTAALDAWTDYLDRHGQPYELLVVDDGSSDDTPAKLAELATRHPHLRVLRHETPRGLGAALRTALEHSTQPLFFYTTLADAYSPGELRKLLDRIDAVHMVQGLRAGSTAPGWAQALGRLQRGLGRVVMGVPAEVPVGWFGVGGTLFRWLNRVVFATRLRDIDSAFKLFRRSVFDRLPIQSDGDFVHAELLAKANFLECLLDEIPIAAKPGPFAAAPLTPAVGSSKFADFCRVALKTDFGKYAPPQPAVPHGQEAPAV